MGYALVSKVLSTFTPMEELALAMALALALALALA